MCCSYNDIISTSISDSKDKEEIILILLSDSEDSDDESEEIITGKISSSSKKTNSSNGNSPKSNNIINEDKSNNKNNSSQNLINDWEKIENPEIQKYQKIETFCLELHGVTLINKSNVIKTLKYWIDKTVLTTLKHLQRVKGFL